MTSPDIVGTALVLVIWVIAGIVAAVGIYVTIVISLAIAGLIRESRERRSRGEIKLFCLRCDVDYAVDCTCDGDCGKRYCKWATTINDAAFRAALDEMLGGEQ